jgi:hypothetical protein
MVIVIFLSVALFLPSQAKAVIIYDNYYGADDHGYGDVIGDPSVFGIDWMDVSISGNQMNVIIKTGYPGSDTLGAGTEYGDFFISTNGWDPYGSSPYLYDNSSNGEDWEYAFDVQTGMLYDISSAQGSILLSNDRMNSSRYIFRDGQEVAIDASGLSGYSTGTAGSYNNGYYYFAINISGLGWQLENLGFHWAAATCGNDVIEGAAPVPEPATMMLLGSGMILLAGFGRKKLFKKGSHSQ